MSNEESMRLMELLLSMGYASDLIMLTIKECAYGKAIGPAFCDAYVHYIEKGLTCKTDTHK